MSDTAELTQIFEVENLRNQAEKLAEVLTEEGIFYKGIHSRNLNPEQQKFINEIIVYAEKPQRPNRLEIHTNDISIVITIQMENVLNDGSRVFMSPTISEVYATDVLDLGILSCEYITECLSYAIDLELPE